MGRRPGGCSGRGKGSAATRFGGWGMRSGTRARAPRDVSLWSDHTLASSASSPAPPPSPSPLPSPPPSPSPSVSPSPSPSLLSYQIQNQVEALNANLLQASIAVNPDENAIIARNPVQVEFNEARAVSQ